MKLRLCLLLSLLCLSLFGSWDWASSIGGAGMERVWDIGCDASSNIFITGDFSDSLYVNGQSYPALGLGDSYVIKYSPEGNFLWAKCFGSTNEDVALSVDTDSAGNSYVTGYYVDRFSIGELSVNANGGWDVYVLKLDPQGNPLWLRSFGGELNDIGYGLAVSPLGRVYIAGWFSGTVNLPGSSSLVSAGGSDVFCYSLDLDGNMLWAKRGGREGVEYGYEVACDASGNAYVTGVAGSGSQFDNLTLTGDGMFVCKYSPTGDPLWLNCGNGGAVIDIAVQPSTAPEQYGMVCGRLHGSGSYGSFPFSSIANGDDAYWAKFDAATGEWLSLNAYGGEAADKGKDVDCESYPAFVASFEANGLFGASNFSSNGESDFVLGWGDPMQFVSAGGEGSEVPTAIKILPNGSIAVSGWHLGLGQIGDHIIDSGNVANLNAYLACYTPEGSSNNDQLSPAINLSIYPNPFSDTTKISCIKAASAQTLEIFNLKGQKINSLHPSSSSVSQNNYLWNGTDARGKVCSSGIYLLRAGSSTYKALKL